MATSTNTLHPSLKTKLTWKGLCILHPAIKFGRSVKVLDNSRALSHYDIFPEGYDSDPKVLNTESDSEV